MKAITITFTVPEDDSGPISLECTRCGMRIFSIVGAHGHTLNTCRSKLDASKATTNQTEFPSNPDSGTEEKHSEQD